MARRLLFSGWGWALLLCVLCGRGLADDAFITQAFPDMTPVSIDHYDADPFKGYVNVTVSNSGVDPWGDFHFQIFPCMGSNVANVDIVDAVGYEPTTDRSPFSYVIDNVTVGSKLDYYFYGDPVTPGNSATFRFYTDNTADKVNFCLMMCPSPVPEPATLGLLASGLLTLGLAIRRRK